MIIEKTQLEQYILPFVDHPGQYAGGEMNSISKDWDQTPVRMAFAFPDSYEIGMSHLGLRLLYEAINSSPYLLERVFMPLPDMQKKLREYNLPLFSLESRHALADFDVIGFTLQYELSYTNILAMLDLAGLPLRSDQRGNEHPVIVAGGPCAYNPEPLADIIDLFFIGEGEELDVEFLALVEQAKQNGWSREELLRRAVAIPGVYVPRFYQAQYDARGNFAALRPTDDAPENLPTQIMKRLVSDFEKAPFPACPILPNIKPVHDRVMLEVMRGCSHGCRFCQAGMIYRPVREKTPQTLRRQAASQCAGSGYEDIALLSLSTADYSCVEQVMNELLDDHAAHGVGISLPSLRVDAFSVNLAARTQEVRKSGITLAPEAGSQRMRDIINKGVTEDDILTAAASAFSQGYTHIKLYFMIGLPFETDSDVVAIAQLCKKILQLGRQNKPAEVKKPLRISLGVSSFVPKSHTPFQWHGQNSTAMLQHKQDLLRDHIRPMRQVTVNFHDRETSLLEAAFARGDRRLNDMLLNAYERGCIFDGWKEHFRPDQWREAFADCGMTQESFAERQIAFGEPLPWSHISCGVRESWLWSENILAGRAELTADCRHGACTDCGICDKEHKMQLVAPEETAVKRQQRRPAPAELMYKYRCQLAIRDQAVWLSHLDILAMVEKTIRRSALPVAFSQGFNPHMQISWGPAHPVGLSSEHEYVDIIFTRPLSDEDINHLAASMPSGLALNSAHAVDMSASSLMADVDFATYAVCLSDYNEEKLDQAIADFINADQVMLERYSPKKGRKLVDVRPAVESLHREGSMLYVGMHLNAGAAAKMPELVTLLDPQAVIVSARRTGMFVTRKGERCLP